MLRIARTASRCTCGSLSSSSSVRSGSASLPPNCAHQVDRRPAHRRVRRVLQPLDRPPADRAEREQDRRQALARARPLFRRQRFGERPDEHLAERHAHRLDALELRVVDRRQVRRRCGASSSRRSARRSRSARCCRRAVVPVAAGFARRGRRSAPPRRRSRRRAADPRAAPTSGVISSRQRSSSCSMRSRSSSSVRSSARSARRRDRAEPGADALGRIVADCLRRRSPASARADSSRAVRVGDERLVGVRRQQLLGDVVPDRLEPLGAAERRRGDVVVRQREQALLLLAVADERLERLREAIGGGAARR